MKRPKADVDTSWTVVGSGPSVEGTGKRQVWKERVQAIKDEGRGLTSWEEGFVASIEEKLDRMIRLSDREEEILETIYVEKTP